MYIMSRSMSEPYSSQILTLRHGILAVNICKLDTLKSRLRDYKSTFDCEGMVFLAYIAFYDESSSILAIDEVWRTEWK